MAETLPVESPPSLAPVIALLETLAASVLATQTEDDRIQAGQTFARGTFELPIATWDFFRNQLDAGVFESAPPDSAPFRAITRAMNKEQADALVELFTRYSTLRCRCLQCMEDRVEGWLLEFVQDGDIFAIVRSNPSDPEAEPQGFKLLVLDLTEEDPDESWLVLLEGVWDAESCAPKEGSVKYADDVERADGEEMDLSALLPMVVERIRAITAQ